MKFPAPPKMKLMLNHLGACPYEAKIKTIIILQKCPRYSRRKLRAGDAVEVLVVRILRSVVPNADAVDRRDLRPVSVTGPPAVHAQLMAGVGGRPAGRHRHVHVVADAGRDVAPRLARPSLAWLVARAAGVEPTKVRRAAGRSELGEVTSRIHAVARGPPQAAADADACDLVCAGGARVANR